MLCSVWLGLGKLGAVSALINTNITGDALLHTLKVVKAKAVLFTDDAEEGNLGLTKTNVKRHKGTYGCDILCI